jgi:hypothetical protein
MAHRPAAAAVAQNHPMVVVAVADLEMIGVHRVPKESNGSCCCRILDRITLTSFVFCDPLFLVAACCNF